MVAAEEVKDAKSATVGRFKVDAVGRIWFHILILHFGKAAAKIWAPCSKMWHMCTFFAYIMSHMPQKDDFDCFNIIVWELCCPCAVSNHILCNFPQGNHYASQDSFTWNYVFFMILQDLFDPLTDLEEMCCCFQLDLCILHGIKTARYSHGWTPVLKLGNIDLAWEYAQNSQDHTHFVDMLWDSPQVFDAILYFM